MTRPDRLLKANQLAVRLQMSVRTLANWRVIGKGPPYRKIEGGLIRYSETEVDAWELSQRCNNTSEYHVQKKPLVSPSSRNAPPTLSAT